MQIRLAVIAPSSFAPLAMIPGTFITEDIGRADVLLVAPREASRLRELLPRAMNVRWIHALAAGVESLPLGDIRARGITLTNSRGLYGDALAEFVIAAMLWFAKDLRRLDRNQSARRWEPYTVERLEGRAVGIIGYGGIGRAVGRRAEAMGMLVTGVRSSESPERAITSSDYLVLSTPLTHNTRGLLSRERIASMPAHAVLINVSRGAVVDETALIEGLRTGRIKGAALDVFETEPLPAESPLWTFDNVLISPHSADHTADSHDRAVRFFLENLERFSREEELQNIVDPIAGY